MTILLAIKTYSILFLEELLLLEAMSREYRFQRGRPRYLHYD